MTSLVLSILNGSSSYLQIKRTNFKILDDFKFRQNPITFMELAALEHLKN